MLSGDDFGSYAFTGREWDAQERLYYYRQRYYDSAAGRFIRKDPIGFAGADVHLFRYCKNDPINYTDPFGLGNGMGKAVGDLPGAVLDVLDTYRVMGDLRIAIAIGNAALEAAQTVTPGSTRRVYFYVDRQGKSVSWNFNGYMFDPRHVTSDLTDPTRVHLDFYFSASIAGPAPKKIQAKADPCIKGRVFDHIDVDKPSEFVPRTPIPSAPRG
jgi:RHS repeat-associated protein